MMSKIYYLVYLYYYYIIVVRSKIGCREIILTEYYTILRLQCRYTNIAS
jgi:hypothetical protein